MVRSAEKLVRSRTSYFDLRTQEKRAAGGFFVMSEKRRKGSREQATGSREREAGSRKWKAGDAVANIAPGATGEILKVEEAILEWIGPEDIERMKQYLLPSETFKKKLLRRIIAMIRGS